MPPLDYLLREAVFYGATINLFLLAMMRFVNPRVWGYQDYPERVKAKVEPPTEQEKRLCYIFAAPYFLFMPLYPVYSLLQLRSLMGGSIAFIDAFVFLLALAASAFLGDLIILDWLIISKITPKWVVIKGSEPADYKDFTHHYVGHAYASLILIGICATVAYAVTVL